MSLWSWLFPEHESVKFVRGLCEAETPKIYTGWALGYLFDFNLCFKEVSIRLEYNMIRRGWHMQISSGSGFLFWYDYSGKAVDYLIERFKLLDTLKPELERYRKNEQQEYEAKQRLKEKYIK